MTLVNQCMAFMIICSGFSVNASTQLLDEDFRRAPDNLKLYFAYAEFKMAHYAKAKLMWENIEGKGKPEAYFNLGIVYELGKGVDSDFPTAVSYYRQAAELGSFSGAYQMGLMHMTAPEHVSKEESIHWLGVAAELGDNDAIELLTAMNTDELDPLTNARILLGKEEYGKAIGSLHKLIHGSDDDNKVRGKAFTQLGLIYEMGKGVEPDLNQASTYFSEAAKLGDPEGMFAIAVMYLTGKGKPQNQEIGNQWMRKSADLGFKRAMDKL
ncbi:tetratricopeptide repeat protein [Alteromonas sp. A081]|uniref:tetratricopeptide repeat protein n=1 Tax=Alteromonas sp. A081 TaxID=3410269 RepID=UPI003B984F20